MNIFKFFKSNPPELVAGLSRITQFDESSNRHTETPDGCKAFGFQLGYNNALDFYKKHGMIPEPSMLLWILLTGRNILSLAKWKAITKLLKILFKGVITMISNRFKKTVIKHLKTDYDVVCNGIEMTNQSTNYHTYSLSCSANRRLFH